MNAQSTQRIPVDLTRAISILAIVVALGAAFVLASEIALILFLGVLFGVFLTKLARWISGRLPVGYRGSLAIVLVTLLVVVVGASTFFFVQINQQIDEARGKFDEGSIELRKLIEQYPALRTTIASTPILSDTIGIDPQKNVQRSEAAGDNNLNNSARLQLDSIPDPVKQAAGTLGQLFKTTFGLVVNSLLIFFVGLFLAISPEVYRGGIVRLVPKQKRERATEVLDATSNSLWRWLIGRFGSMLATGLGAFFLLLILGVPMAGTLGILTALLTFVPNIGAAIALFLAIMFALPQGTGTVAAVVGGYMALQLFESYVVTPLIQQKAVSLPPAMLIAFQAIMGVPFGFIGAAVASPLLAAAKTIIEMLYVDDYLENESTANGIR